MKLYAVGVVAWISFAAALVVFGSTGGVRPVDSSATMSMNMADGVRVYHDDDRGVTCWILFQNGISCLPDSATGLTR